MSIGIIQPSWKTGFARNAYESAYPELWSGLISYHSAMLGNSGSRLTDHVSRKFNANITGANLKQAWSGAQQLSLDGVDDRIDIDPISIPAKFTVFIMWKPNSVPSTNAAIFETTNALGDFSRLISLRYEPSQRIRVFIRMGGTNSSKSTNSTFSLGVFKLLTLTYDGSVARMYADGVLESGAQATGSDPPTGNTWIGSTREFTPTHHNMTYKFSAVYNRIITRGEMNTLVVDPIAPLRLRESMPMFVAAAGGGGATSFIPYKNYMKPLLVR